MCGEIQTRIEAGESCKIDDDLATWFHLLSYHSCMNHSRQDRTDDVTGDVGDAFVAAAVEESQFGMIETHEVKDCRMEVVHMGSGRIPLLLVVNIANARLEVTRKMGGSVNTRISKRAHKRLAECYFPGYEITLTT